MVPKMCGMVSIFFGMVSKVPGMVPKMCCMVPKMCSVVPKNVRHCSQMCGMVLKMWHCVENMRHCA